MHHIQEVSIYVHEKLKLVTSLKQELGQVEDAISFWNKCSVDAEKKLSDLDLQIRKQDKQIKILEENTQKILLEVEEEDVISILQSIENSNNLEKSLKEKLNSLLVM